VSDKRKINDSEAAALLSSRALIEIRYLAWQAISEDDQPPAEKFERIHFLANLCHNLPGIARAGPRVARDRSAMEWVWSTAGPEGQTWILDTIRDADCEWTPPDPHRPPAKGPPRLSVPRKLGAALGRWPVRAPLGRRSLPPNARVVKALNTEKMVVLHEEAERLELGLGSSSRSLRAHLDPDGVHYLMPDPASYYWPDPEGEIRWWECRALLRMYNGTQVSTSLAVLPERFDSLSDNLPRRRQRELAHLIRATGYDLYLWGQDHKDDCGPDQCGYRPSESAD
jgi:hypothetical protein